MATANTWATIIVGVVFLLLGVFVRWPDTRVWYQVAMARALMFSISAGSLIYLYVTDKR